MEMHLKIIGCLLVMLSLLHLLFPKYFRWAQELAAVSLINRQIMYVHTFFIAVVVFLTGTLCLTSSNEILSTVLGKRLALGLGIFWLLRLFVQFFGYSSTLWKGKQFETFVHVVFAFLWAYVSVIFLLIYFL